jgi:hypothetical protein
LIEAESSKGVRFCLGAIFRSSQFQLRTCEERPGLVLDSPADILSSCCLGWQSKNQKGGEASNRNEVHVPSNSTIDINRD